MKSIDLTGNIYGRLTAVRFVIQENNRRKWLCLCTCGKEVQVTYTNLVSGAQESCGCLKKELVAAKNTTHGLAKHPLYKVWCDMKARCYNPKKVRYERYGGRGITVCQRWLDSFDNFYKDVIEGYAPGLEFDRFPNNDGNYEPDNFRWATPTQNIRNSSLTKLTEDDAEYIRSSGLSTRELMNKFGVNKSTIYNVQKGRTWKK